MLLLLLQARILDEAINYIQRLESITNVLKREHGMYIMMIIYLLVYDVNVIMMIISDLRFN